MGFIMRAAAMNEFDAVPDIELDDAEELAVDAFAPVELVLAKEDCGERLDKALSRWVPQFSRSRLQQWMEAGHVTIDGRAAKAKETVYGDERIVVHPQPAPEEQAFKPERMDLPIVYEDDAIIVVDKPVGLVVHPAAGNWSGTLLNGLLHHFPGLAGVPRAGIVHRLDKDTSGLMVVAKTLEAHTDLVRQLQARTVKREYLAMVWGVPKTGGTIDAPIGRHPRDRIKMAVLNNDESAKPAITHFEKAAAGKLDGKPVSLVRCRLETGRTHQIRVHLTSIGFPLIGDTLYGKAHLANVFPRQALQAWRLGLVHPESRKDCEWTVPLAHDFAELVASAGIDAPLDSTN